MQLGHAQLLLLQGLRVVTGLTLRDADEQLLLLLEVAVLGGTGVAERKFDSLAEAVQYSSAGDTIEVRTTNNMNVSATRSPNDTQKNGATRSIVRMGRRTFWRAINWDY